MSASTRGTAEDPERNVCQKAGLNKAILDHGWYKFWRQLAYKLTWRGGCCCVTCGYTNHADFIGAINILRRAGHARIAG